MFILKGYQNNDLGFFREWDQEQRAPQEVPRPRGHFLYLIPLIFPVIASCMARRGETKKDLRQGACNLHALTKGLFIALRQSYPVERLLNRANFQTYLSNPSLVIIYPFEGLSTEGFVVTKFAVVPLVVKFMYSAPDPSLVILIIVTSNSALQRGFLHFKGEGFSGL